jgi:hypothetical protein
MDRDRDEKIRARAYQIWEREGRTGDAQEHWLRAEQEIGAEVPAADKMGEQVKVAMDARKARSKETGRAGRTALRKPNTDKPRPA